MSSARGRRQDIGSGDTMAQASSVQREPSMEEILASIRRIIEDGESGRKETPAEASVVEEDREVESFRAGLKPAAARQVSDAEERSGKGGSGPGALDRLRESLREEERGMSDPGPAVANDEGHNAAHPMVTPHLQPVASGDGEEPVSAPRSVPAAVERQETSEGTRRPILSDASGRKVAAAFGELNEALMESRRQSLDQLAEEMLRPMLQDWLDDNLPQLVERLVREEIERIARGA